MGVGGGECRQEERNGDKEEEGGRERESAVTDTRPATNINVKTPSTLIGLCAVSSDRQTDEEREREREGLLTIPAIKFNANTPSSLILCPVSLAEVERERKCAHTNTTEARTQQSSHGPVWS